MRVDTSDVLIIGAGPAGIFTALELAKNAPELKVRVVDMGKSIVGRHCPARATGHCVHCKPCAIMHGWAGAGAFSDGKLSLSSDVGGQIADYVGVPAAEALIRDADRVYLACGAPVEVHGQNDPAVEQIRYEAQKHNITLVPCPVRHLGTERAAMVLGAMEQALLAHPNATFDAETTAETLRVKDGHIEGAILKGKDGNPYEVRAPYVVAAPGRGGAQWLKTEMDRLGVKTSNNEVDIGVRVEVPNAVMDHLTKHLYEAKLVYYSDTYENRVRTFCMNPGGVVSSEYYEGGIAVVNGHSYGETASLTEYTNFAVLVSTRFTEPFNQPIEYGRYVAKLGNMLTGGPIMVQRLGDLLAGRRTDATRLQKSTTVPTLTTAVPGDLSFVLPSRHLTSIVEALKAFDKLAPGLFSRNTLLYGVEVKFYSSKVQVNERFQSDIEGLYAIGDGAGITRGLMQASCTGLVVARDIAQKQKEQVI